MKSTGHYVHRHILKQQNKDAYVAAVKDCLTVFADEYRDTCASLRVGILSHQAKAEWRYPSKMFNKRDEERKYHILACEHALDIVNSLEKRYIVGGADPEPRGIQAKGRAYVEYENLFD